VLESGELLAAAGGKGLDETLLREKLGRLGGSRFHLETLDVSLTGALMLPVSALNRLRRALVERLENALAQPPARREHAGALTALRSSTVAVSVAGDPELAVFCRSEAQIRAACAAGVDRVYADFEDPRGFRDSVAVARQAGVPIYLATPRIEKPGEEGFFRKLAGYAPDGVLIRNLGGLLYFKEQHPGFDLVGDFSLNCANDLTARELQGLGLRLLVPSYDLNAQQLEGLLTRYPAGAFEIVLHQYMPMFHMEHCVFAAFLSSGKDYRDCGRPCERHDVELRDHTGAVHPVKADVGCRNTVFNGHAQSGALYLDRFQALGVRHFRIEMLTESEGRARELIETYRGLLERRFQAQNVWRTLKATQRLGVTRGTLDR
jgi:putative protease